jgi:sugar porter (SP) family MFS transporter
MTSKKVIFWAFTVALGGFLFGFDTAVISGAEKSIQQLWGLTTVQHGFTVSIALIGTVLGSLTGAIPSERYGRKYTLFAIAVLYLLSSIGSALASDWISFLIFRFLGGIGVGISSVTAPLYISEISPANSRGRLVAMFQFNVVLGILIAYLSNFLLVGLGDNDWRWMLGVQAFPSLIFLVAILFVPESPRWLIVKRGRVEEARHILSVANGGIDVSGIVSDIQNSALAGSQSGNSTSIFSSQYKLPLLLALLFAFFNQVSGINAIIYYAPRIFEMAGLGKSSALLSSAGVGLVNFCFTFIAINLIDRFGRRTLMFIGSFGLIATLGLVAQAFYSGNLGGYAVPVYLFIYIAGGGDRVHLSLRRRNARRRQHFHDLLRDDGAPTDFCVEAHARNQGNLPRTDRKNVNSPLKSPL